MKKKKIEKKNNNDTLKEKMNNKGAKGFRFSWVKKIVNVVLIIFFVVICIWVPYLLYRFLPNNIDEIYINYLSAILGGVCTLGGVWFANKYDRSKTKNEEKEKNKPTLYIPAQYDITKAVHVVSSDDNPLRDRILYLKNSDRCDFILTDYELNHSRNQHLSTPYYIGKEQLFTIPLESPDNTTNIILTVRSIDNSIYNCEIEKNSNDSWTLTNITESEKKERWK